MSAHCEETGWPLSDVFGGWCDYWGWTNEEGQWFEDEYCDPGNSTATRTKKLDSIFGELGGKWTFDTPEGTCDVTFENNDFGARCGSTAINITFNVNDGTASGTFRGLDIMAIRR